MTPSGDSKILADRPSAPPSRPLVSFLLILLTLAACSSPPSPEATGPELFDQLCSSCHAADLEGGIGPSLGPGSPSATLPDEYLVNSIRRGIGTMPSFDHLSEAQVARLVSFIRRIQTGE